MTLIVPSFFDCYLLCLCFSKKGKTRLKSWTVYLFILILSSTIDYLSRAHDNIFFLEIVVLMACLPIVQRFFEGETLAFFYGGFEFMLKLSFFNMAAGIIAYLSQYYQLVWAGNMVPVYFIVTRTYLYYRIKNPKKDGCFLTKFFAESIFKKFIGFIIGIIILCFIFTNLLLQAKGFNFPCLSGLLLFFLLVILFAYVYTIFKTVLCEMESLYHQQLIFGYHRISQDYLEMLDKKTEELRMLNHNIKDHFLMIRYYTEENQIEKLRSYLKKMMGFQGEAPFIGPPSLKYIAPLIQSKIKKAEEVGIQVHFKNRLKQDTTLAIEEVDLVLLVANLLDNAIEAVSLEGIERKEIDFTIGIKDAYLYFKTNNPFVREFLIIENDLFKTDHNDVRRGNGMKIMGLIAEKYNGWLEHKVMNDNIEIKVVLENLNHVDD